MDKRHTRRDAERAALQLNERTKLVGDLAEAAQQQAAARDDGAQDKVSQSAQHGHPPSHGQERT